MTTIAEVRGAGPIITTTAAVTTSSVGIEYDYANHDGTQGCYYMEWTPFKGQAEVPQTGSLPLLRLSENTGNGVLSRSESGGTVRSTDSAYTTVDVGSVWESGVTQQIGVAFGDAKFQATANGVSGAEKSYSGGFVGTQNIFLGNRGTPVAGMPPRLFRNIQRYDLPYDEAKAKILELME